MATKTPAADSKTAQDRARREANAATATATGEKPAKTDAKTPAKSGSKTPEKPAVAKDWDVVVSHPAQGKPAKITVTAASKSDAYKAAEQAAINDGADPLKVHAESAVAHRAARAAKTPREKPQPKGLHEQVAAAVERYSERVDSEMYLSFSRLVERDANREQLAAALREIAETLVSDPKRGSRQLAAVVSWGRGIAKKQMMADRESPQK